MPVTDHSEGIGFVGTREIFSVAAFHPDTDRVLCPYLGGLNRVSALVGDDGLVRGCQDQAAEHHHDQEEHQGESSPVGGAHESVTV